MNREINYIMRKALDLNEMEFKTLINQSDDKHKFALFSIMKGKIPIFDPERTITNISQCTLPEFLPPLKFAIDAVNNKQKELHKPLYLMRYLSRFVIEHGIDGSNVSNKGEWINLFCKGNVPMMKMAAATRLRQYLMKFEFTENVFNYYNTENQENIVIPETKECKMDWDNVEDGYDDIEEDLDEMYSRVQNHIPSSMDSELERSTSLYFGIINDCMIKYFGHWALVFYDKSNQSVFVIELNTNYPDGSDVYLSVDGPYLKPDKCKWKCNQFYLIDNISINQAIRICSNRINEDGDYDKYFNNSQHFASSVFKEIAQNPYFKMRKVDNMTYHDIISKCGVK